MKSMTGYGRGAEQNENSAVAVELKTVNNRFLDINLRLPNELQPFEADIKRIITNRLSRGRVDVNLQFESAAAVNYELNRPMIAGYLDALRRIQKEFEVHGEPDLNVIARLPNALQAKAQELGDETKTIIEKALNNALDELEKMREAEGESLYNELEMRLSGIEKGLPTIENEAENVAEEYRERLTKKINEMLAKTDAEIELDEARLAQEVAYLANRSDITEEITRLKSHIEQFRQIMNEENEVGKRLDFLTQELNREANTIASKTQNITVKEASLTIKSEIEKIREQVQNVE